MKLKEFMDERGEEIAIYRDNSFLKSVVGMRNSQKGRKMFQFYPETDINPGDWIKLDSTDEESL